MFFFKQKTAYDMRISDWSSDVCSSDLEHTGGAIRLEDDGVVRCAEGRADSHPRSAAEEAGEELDLIAATLEPADHMEGGLRGASGGIGGGAEDELVRPITADHGMAAGAHRGPGSNQRVDRQSVVSGKIVPARVDLGGCLLLKKKIKHTPI